MKSKYPFIKKFSADIGISEDILQQAFELEKEFHFRVLKETDPDVRKQLYKDIYDKVHTLYGKAKLPVKHNPKMKLIEKFSDSFTGKNILDVGCGNGDLLRAIRETSDPNKLVGVDGSDFVLRDDYPLIEFIKADIIKFELNQTFDFIFSDNVIEHIAPADLDTHLNSLTRMLKPNGKLIILMPNKLFGPSDVTRIIDYTYMNKIPAQGTHVNETTYSEIIRILQKHGFRKFKTILPIPKLKYLFPKVRINAKFVAFLENQDWFIKLLYKFKINGQCFFRLDIFLECTQ